MKKMTAMLLALCLLLISSLALAEEGVAPPMGDAVWLYDEWNDSVYVEGALSGDVVIPAEVDGNATHALLFSSLCDQNDVTSLTLPNTMYALQDTSIAHMSGLQSITLNDGLEAIGATNFNRCPALTSVTIPASVRLINSAFMQCDNLREIRFEGECPVFVDPEWCFFWMPDDYVIYVPDDQFDAYAAALESANDAVEHLQPSGKNAVAREVLDTESWFTFDEATGAITGYTQDHAYVEIPETIGGVTVKSVAQDAMYGNASIFGLVLPEGIEHVENSAFQNAYNIAYIKLPSTLKTIGDDAFSRAQCSRIDWSEGLEEIGARAFMSIHATTLTLPSTVKSIGESAFERSPLGELYLSGDLASIGSRAFADCFLSYMAFDFYAPIDIAADAFANSNVADLDLPWDSSFENQAAYAEMLREQCPNCTVWINNPVSAGVAEHPVYGESISRFENGVWTMYKGDQPDLTLWTLFDDIKVTALGDGVFKGSQTIRSFYPHHCGWFTDIGDEAFADSTVEYVELFGSITTIGKGAFRNCLNLKELTLPASLTSIGEDALAGCDNLQTLTILCDPAILPDGLLDECFAHTEIYAAPNATDEQVRLLSEKAHRPWYAPVARVGEATKDLIEMPYAMFLIDDFWYDTEYARLDRYHGYELNLYLPREAEGMTLRMIGGDMMGRARAGDNFEMELPVRSVVIPENYTEIPYFAFENCETLETVICYAPIELLDYGTFSDCTNLREVVFVNGVRNLDKHIFSNCPNLETVYLGPYVESMDEYAFLNMDGTPGFDPDRVITDPAQMPDVEVLLKAVKSDPMPEPTPAPTSAPAVPVGEAGAPYIGTWRADTLEMDGEVYPVAIMGMEMYFSLNADGTAESYDGETSDSGTWWLDDGVVTVEGMALALDEDGQLVMEEDGMKLCFVKDGAEVQAEPTTPPISTSEAAVNAGDAGSFIGTWRADTLEMDGEVYPVAIMGMEMYFSLNADGTAESYDGETSDSGTWWLDDGTVTVEGMALALDEEGQLVMEEDGMKLCFVKIDGAPAVSIDPPFENEEGFIGTWYGCYMATGVLAGDPRELFEIILTVNADGSANLAYPTDELWHWTENEDGSLRMVKDSDGNEMPLRMLNESFLCLGSMDGDGNAFGGYIIFSRDASAIWTPDMLIMTTMEPIAETDAGIDVSAELSSRMDIRYVCQSADAGGVTLSASMLGGEYALTFHANGTVDFVMVGNTIPGLKWTQGDGSFIIDYYGNTLEAVLTENGLDMNYFDSMMMHFVPAT